MKKHHWIACLTLLLFIGILIPSASSAATRAFSPRFSANNNGDIYLIGNTAMTCNGGCAQQNGAGDNGYLTMVYVDIDGDGSTTQSSSATLSMPAGSTVLWAGLYWQADSNNVNRGTALFKSPSSSYQTITASQLDFVTGQGCGGNCTAVDRYGAFADVTNIVANGGNGTYTVANITGSPNNQNTYGGWGMVVAFSNNALPMRNLTVFDGYQDITTNVNGNPTPNPNVFIPVSGFLAPFNGPVNTNIGVIAGEGDRGNTGDNFRLNGVGLVDPIRVTNDFFSSYISNMGALVTAKTPNYSNQLGWDVARINASNILANGATSATINLNTNGDWYYASAVSFVTDLYVPIIVPNVTKVGVDVNGGNLVPGDILRYTITMNNTGYDTGTNLSVIDNIPAFTSYVPGSLTVISGPAGAPTGVMNDVSGDDAAEYIAAGTPRVVFRLGSGANATNGGNLAQGQSTSLSFDVQLSSSIPSGTILSNSAQISYSGQTLGVVYAAASSAASSSVFVPPSVTKTFNPPVVGDTTGTSTLSIVFSNPASNIGPVTGVAVTDTYPAGLVNATPANPSLTCTAGSTAGSIVGGVAGGNTIGLTGTTIAQNGSCTLSVTVKGTGNGIFTNNLGQVTTTNAGNTVSPSATAVFSVGRPAISKAFSTPSMLIGSNATITFTLSNPTATPFTLANFTDTYPAGLVNAAPLTVGGTCGGRTVDAATLAGGGVFNLTGANIPNGGSCTVTVLVTSSTGGSYNNTTSGVATFETPTAGAPSNTANLLVYAPATATKAFTPVSVSTSGVSQLAITVTNPNPAGMSAVTGAAFTDTYPANLVNTATPTPVITCTAGSSAALVGGAAGGSTIGISGGTIASGGSCTITVFVTSAIANTYNDNADTINTTNAGSGTVPAASLNVSAFTPPGTTKSFTGPIAANQPSVMTIALTNSNPSGITGVNFTDSYPAGLVNTATPSITNTCGGTVTAVAGGNSLSLSGATIPTTGCTVTVNVTSAAPGAYFNNTGLIFTGNAGVGAGAVGSLQVLAPPTITKSFGTNPIATSGATTLTLTLTNPAGNTVSLTGVGVIDTYPAGLTNAAAANGTTTCGGGTVTAANNGPSVSLSGATIPVGGSCTVTVNLRAPAAPGEYTNTTNPVTTTNAGSGAAGASAILSVGEPGITKSFGTSPILAGGTSLLTITLTNPTGVAMTLAAFTDTYPAGMTNTGAPGGATNCVGGSVTAANNGPSVALSGATIPANGSCWVTVNVTATVTATNTIPAGALTVNGGANNANPASVILQVTPPPVATKSFSPASIKTSTGAATSTLTITITNPTSNTINGVAFTDNYPSATLDNFAASTINCTAGSSGTRTGNLGNSFVGMTGGTLLGNGSCTITVPVYSNTAGTYNNSTGNITSTNGGTGLPDTSTLTVLTPFTVAKAFSPATVNVAPDSTTLTITLTNPNATAVVTGVAFTDTYPANLVNTTPAVASTTCGGTVTAADGGGSLSLSGGTIPAGGSCAVTSVVASTTAGNKINPVFTATSDNDGTAALPAAVTLTVVALAAPTVTKTFATPSVLLNGTSVLTIAVTNTTGTNITGITFTDTYPVGSGIVNTNNATAPNIPAGSCRTGLPTGLTGGTAIGMNNMTINAGRTCTLTVTVRGTVPGTWINSTGLVPSTNAANGGPSTDTLTVVLPPPTIAKSFAAPIVALNGSVNTSFLISNPTGAFGLTGISFTDNLPAGLSATNGTTATCGGSMVITGGNTLTFTGGTLAGGANCTITVPVTGTAAGVQNNTTGVISSNESGSGAASNLATVTVLAPPAIAKAFGAVYIVTGATTALNLTVANPNSGTALTGIAFTDTLPAGLTAVNGSTAICGGSQVITGTNLLTFTGGSLAAGANCVISTTVTGATAGVKNNTTGAVTAGGPIALTGAASNTATVTVSSSPTIAKAFSPATVDVSITSTMTFTLTNSNSNTLTSANFTDTLTGFSVAAPATIGGTCAGVTNSPALVAGATALNLTVPSLAAGSCTITIPVSSSSAGAYTNTTSGITTVETGAAVGSPSNSADLTVIMLPLQVTKTPSVLTTTPGSIINYVISYANPNAATWFQGVVITDPVPVYTTFQSAVCGALPAAITTCTISAPAVGGTGTVTWTLGGNLNAGSTGTVTLSVRVD